MKRILVIVCLLLGNLVAWAQEYSFQTQDLQLTIDGNGMVTDLSVCGQKIAENQPILIGCTNVLLTFPSQFEPIEDNRFMVKFDNGSEALLEMAIKDHYLTLKILEQSGFDALQLLPLRVSLNECVGEILGVAQGSGFAFGIQALNAKTQAGLPFEFASLLKSHLRYEGNPEWAAVATNDGTWMQFHAWDRSRDRRFGDRLIMSITGEEAQIDGAAIALFGCPRETLLKRLGEIEVGEGLPQTERSTNSYLISNYNQSDATYVLERGRQAGLDIGLSVLANRIPTNSNLVGPSPSKHLLIQGPLQLQLPIDATQTEMAVYQSDLFAISATINVLLIDNELITYRSTEHAGNIHLLYECTRGAFGTKKAAHSLNATVYKLWDSPERTLLPDYATQNQMAHKEAERCARAGIPLLIFNDLKSYAYNGHGDLALSRFLEIMRERNPEKILQADYLTHASWHYLSRVSDNRLWNESLSNIMLQTLFEKQDFYNRNLFPWMIGNFNIHLADRMKPATTLEELEWFLAYAAAFDAGFGLEFDPGTMRRHGLTEEMLNTINLWESLRLAHAFTDRQKELFKDPYAKWHIEKNGDSAFLVYPQYISRRYLCDFSNDTWTWNNPYEGRFALRIAVTGNGSISEPSFRTPNGILRFPCTIKAGQYLIYNLDGTAYITDQNFNKITDVASLGVSVLDEGMSEVSFTCEVKPEGQKQPGVYVRFMTRSTPASFSSK